MFVGGDEYDLRPRLDSNIGCSAKAIATKAQGGVIEQCGHWVFQERTDFICDELDHFWAKNI